MRCYDEYTDRLVLVDAKLRFPKLLWLEQEPKTFEDALNLARKSVKAGNDRFTFKNLAERFLVGKAQILMIIHPSICRYPDEFVAVFQRSHNNSTVIRESHGMSTEQTLFDVPYAIGDRKEQAMLIGNIKFVESPKEIASPFVWFVSRNDLDCLEAGSLYYFFNRGFQRFGHPITEYWERRMSTNCSTIHADQLTGQVVKARSQVVNGIADDDGDSFRRMFDNVEVYNLAPSIKIVIKNSSIGIASFEVSKFGFEILDVFIGPFDLCVN